MPFLPAQNKTILVQKGNWAEDEIVRHSFYNHGLSSLTYSVTSAMDSCGEGGTISYED